jgi:protein ImuB
MLWIALHLPHLSFESWRVAWPPDQHDQPAALMDAQGVLVANTAARDLGVQPGLRRATALALAPTLAMGRVDAARDRQAITAVAHAALAFTPAVTFAVSASSSTGGRPSTPSREREAPHTVLLQVQASLRYFGGRIALMQRLHATLRPLGHTVCIASAPTALGAALLARMAGLGLPAPEHCADRASLSRALDASPVGLLGGVGDHRTVLEGMGLHTLGDLRRLPRTGLVSRLGDALLDELERALGERPDPPPSWITLPEVFEARIELLARADTTGQVLHGAGLLIEPLLAWARARQVLVQGFMLFMHHEQRHRRDSDSPAVSQLPIALASASRDAGHLFVLLRERLAHLQLKAPTLELRLRCADVVDREPPNAELFPSAREEHEGLTRLIERLQARLGGEQVQRLAHAADHRPERAVSTEPVSAEGLAWPQVVHPQSSRSTAVRPRASPRSPAGRHHTPQSTLAPRHPDSTAALPVPASRRGTARTPIAPRPVWLLNPPQSLPERRAGPWLDGHPLQLLCGPERIESGWWDAALTERDYFIAQTHDGALVWIYRARLPLSVPGEAQGWFLHGRFG